MTVKNKLYLFLSAVIVPTALSAQTDSVLVNLLKTPASPAFEIMGTSPTLISRPETPTDLSVSIMNATNDLTSLPENYALEFAPVWVFAGKKITYESFQSYKKPLTNMGQTLKLSVGISPVEPYAAAFNAPVSTSRMGTGFRFSVLRGKIDDKYEGLHDKLDSIYMLLKSVNRDFSTQVDSAVKRNTAYAALQTAFDSLKKDPVRNMEAMRSLTASMQAMKQNIQADVEKSIRETDSLKIGMLKKLNSQLQFRRYGWKLDVSAAAALDFRNDRTDNSAITSYGSWLTGGYEWQKSWSVLGGLRLLNELPANPDNISGKDTFSVDAGSRIIFDAIGKLSISGEFLYRLNSNKDSDPSGKYRYSLGLDYLVAKNKVLSFTIGKDFDKPVATGGNLIAAVNLLLGFGSQRPIH